MINSNERRRYTEQLGHIVKGQREYLSLIEEFQKVRKVQKISALRERLKESLDTLQRGSQLLDTQHEMWQDSEIKLAELEREVQAREKELYENLSLCNTVDDVDSLPETNRLTTMGQSNLRFEVLRFAEYVIPSSINGATIKACPDSGSMFDIVSKRLAQANGWSIDSTKSEIITLPSRKRLSSLGTIEADFRFQGEQKSYRRIFHVIDNCIHDVILGNTFLKTTQTLTKFAHRIKEMVVKKSRKCRLRYLGTPLERFRCSLKNQSIWALGDTGADLTFISLRLCKRLNLPIQKQRDYRV